MSIELLIRRSGQETGGNRRVIRHGTGEIDTQSEARQALRFFPRQDRDQYVAVVGSQTYTYQQLVDIRDAVVTIRGTIAPLGPVTGTLPGDPMGSHPDIVLHGAGSFTVNNRTNGQRYRVTIQRDGRVRFRTEGAAQPNVLELDANIGRDLIVMLRSTTRASDIDINITPQGVLQVSLRDFSLLSRIPSGQVRMGGGLYCLSDIDTSAGIESMTLSINPQTRVIELTVTPHASPPLTPPPNSTQAFLTRWNRQAYARYREQLQDPNRRHLAVLTEANARLPGSLEYFPPGRGSIYINLPPRANGERTHRFSVNLRTIEQTQARERAAGQEVTATPLQAAIQNLRQQVWQALDIRRLHPNPPLPSTSPRESVVYNATQDTLFILNRRDDELITAIGRAFGLERNQARRLFENGRIQISDIIRRTPYMPPQTVRSLVRAFFDTRDPASRYFTNRGNRFFLALGNIRHNLRELVGFNREIWWHSQVRSTIMQRFPVDDEDASYRGAMPAGTDGANQTATAFIPYPPQRILPLLQNMADHRYWVPWVTASSRQADGSFRGTIDGRFNYHVRAQSRRYGATRSTDAVQTFSYAPVTGDDSGNAGFQVFAGRNLLIPVRDPRHPERGVVGTFLVQQQAIDFTGTDANIVQGRVENFSRVVDSSQFALRGEMLSELGERIIPLMNPNRDPTRVHAFRINRGISNLYQMLSRGRTAAQVNPNGHAQSVSTLRYAFTGMDDASRPPEFMEFHSATQQVDGREVTTTEIRLTVSERERDRVAQLMVSTLGVERSWADQRIQQGRIPIADIASLPWVRQQFSAETVTSFARLILQDMPAPFIGRGDRFLHHLGDIRANIQSWIPQAGAQQLALDFRNFAPGRFHRWSGHNSTPADSTDSVAYSVFPNDISAQDLLRVFSRPHEFNRYSSRFTRAAQVACEHPESGRSCYDVSLDITVRVVDYRIETPSTIQHVGNIGYAPWTWARRPNISEQGMEENEGYWAVLPLEGNRGTLVLRVGLLNTIQAGDVDLAEQAFRDVASFLTGIYHRTQRQSSSGTPRTGVSFQYRQLFRTPEAD